MALRAVKRMEPRYLATVARSQGVPEMWVDDAVQDMTIAAWRFGERFSPYRSAIDAARRYGPRSRNGIPRDHAELSLMLPSNQDVERQVIAVLDLETVIAFFPRLSRGERQAMASRLRGEVGRDVTYAQTHQARRKLLALV